MLIISSGTRSSLFQQRCSSQYIGNISEIILNPDYIGKHPTILFSIEFIKIYEYNILVAVQFDEKDDYYHISNVYDITNGKIEHKFFSGRFKKYI